MAAGFARRDDMGEPMTLLLSPAHPLVVGKSVLGAWGQAMPCESDRETGGSSDPCAESLGAPIKEGRGWTEIAVVVAVDDCRRRFEAGFDDASIVRLVNVHDIRSILPDERLGFLVAKVAGGLIGAAQLGK